MYNVGLTCGVFDLFHIGHLNILKNCKKYCKYLIVSILSDEYCKYRKGKYPIIKQEDRYSIIESIKYVDKVIFQTYDFQVLDFIKQYNIDIVFKGSDKIKDSRWNEFYRNELEKLNKKLMFFNYTIGISTSEIINKIRNET